MLTNTQKKAIQAIVNIFETGRPQGEYGQVTLLAGDSGHLTYGRSQTTLASGNLHLLIRAYCNNEDAEYAEEMAGYLERLADCNLALDHNMKFRRLLRDAGDDPVMQTVQDGFDRVYWTPARRTADALDIGRILGVRSFHATCNAYLSDGYTLKEIGEYFKKHYSTISRIVKRE